MSDRRFDQRRAKARMRALSELATRYPDEYRRIYEQKLAELGYEQRRVELPSDLLAQAVEAYANGEPSRTVALRFGIAPSTVTRHARRSGVKVRPQGRPKTAAWRAEVGQ